MASLDELLDAYFNVVWAEGRESRAHDRADPDKEQARNAILDFFKAQQERSADMTIHTYVDISTGHVSRATMELLSSAGAIDNPCREHGWPAMTIAPYEYGVFITVPNLDDPECCSQQQRNALPLELELILTYALRHGAQVVRLDADGDVIEGLQLFDW
jgi:hypothetical protein